MNFVDIERRVVHRMLGLLVPELLVAPAETGEIIQFAGGGRPGLRMEPIGVGLEVYGAVRTLHRILIGGIYLQVRDKALPDLSVFRSRAALRFQSLKSPTTETALAWGAHTRNSHPVLPRFSAGWAPNHFHPSVNVPA